MATCSKYEQGYDDNRFEIVVGEEFHCSICLLVLKDPVMCKNEHYYCSSCIKEHLENARFCPTCRVHLSVETLIQAPRIVIEYLSKLNIHCNFYPRGCREVIQLTNLKCHVASCGFSPVQCSNDGCNVLLNKRDKLHHEAEICDFRRSKCHERSQLKNVMKEIKDKMLHRQDQIKNEIKEINVGMNEMKEMKNEMKQMKREIREMFDQILVRQGQLEIKMVNEIKEEITIQMKKEMKEEIKIEMKEIVMNAERDAMAGKKDLEVEMKNSKRSSHTTCSSDVRENIIVTGGVHRKGKRRANTKSTESFNWADQTWTLLDFAVFEGRYEICSFLYHGQMVVVGENDGSGNKTNTLKCLDVADPAATWKDFAVKLPVKCAGHQVVNYNDRLFISGGWVQDDTGRSTSSDAIREVQLAPPYYSTILTRLPQPRCNHGMELFDNKWFILGGCDSKTITKSVVQYDLIKSKYQEMPPLPYAVEGMATVLWQNNVLVIGGWNQYHTTLDTVLMYDVITGRSQVLPRMKRKRRGCTAVLTGNVVVVMGGVDENQRYLTSVECFDLEHQVWQDLPDMLEPRAYATAVVKNMGRYRY